MAIDPLVFKIDGNAVGAVKAIEEVTKKLDTLKSQERALQAAMGGVNTQTEDGKRVFAALKAELDAVNGKMSAFSASSAKAGEAGKVLHDSMGKTRAVMGALGQVTGSSSAAFAAATNAAGGLAQAFAAGGPMALGIAAATIAVGQLSDAIGRYIEKSSLAETKGFTESMGKIASGSSISRALADRTAGLKEELGITTKLEKLQREKAALDAQEQQLQSMATTKVRTEDEITALVGYKKSLRDVREQRFLITQAIEQETIAQQKAIEAQETALAAAEKQKEAAEALLRLERARAGLAAANAASAVEAEDRALGLNNPDPGAGLFGSQTPVATAEQIKAMNELFMMAPSADPAEHLIEAAEHITVASEKWQSTGDRFASALTNMAGLLANPSIAGALTGNASSLGGIGSMVGGALGGPAGGVVGGALGSTLGDGLGKLIDKLDPFGELVSSIADVMMSLEPIWVITATNANALAGVFDVLAGVVRIGAEIFALLQVPMRVVTQLFTDLTPDVGDLSESLMDAADRINQAARFFAGGIADVINAVIDGINFVMRQMNERFGTDLPMISKVVVADMFSVSEAAAEAGEAIRENLTDEFVNLPPGFKTGGAVFAATDVGGAGGGSGGLTIGTVNVSTTRTLLDELKSLQDRAGIGSSSIIGGRNSISDRRN